MKRNYWGRLIFFALLGGFWLGGCRRATIPGPPTHISPLVSPLLSGADGTVKGIVYSGKEIWNIEAVEWDQGRLWLFNHGTRPMSFDGERWTWWGDSWDDVEQEGDGPRELVAAGGRVYSKTYYGDLVELDQTTGRWVGFEPGLSGLRTRVDGGLAADDSGKLYAIAQRGYLNVYDGRRWKTIPMPLPQNDDRGPGLYSVQSYGAVDANGNYWFSDSLRVFKYDGREWTVYAFPYAHDLVPDSRGRIWFKIENGVSVLEKGEWWVYTDTARLGIPGFGGKLAVDPDLRVWIVGEDGVTIFNGREFRTDPVSSKDRVLWNALDFDAAGDLWIGGFDTITVYREPADLAPLTELTLPPDQRIPAERLVLPAGQLVAPEPLPLLLSRRETIWVVAGSCGLCLALALLSIRWELWAWLRRIQ